MLHIHEVESFLKYTPAPLQDIVLELRRGRTRFVGAVSAIFTKDAGASARASVRSVCMKATSALISSTFFIRLEEIAGGDSKGKAIRRIKSYEEAPWEDLKELIEESSHFDQSQVS
jgi:hypothetical protein